MRFAGVVILALCTPLGVAGDVTGADVRRTINAAIRLLETRQNGNGTWTDHAHPGGMTCLATLALLQAGVKPDAPSVTRALNVISSLPNSAVYVVSLKIMALAAADTKRYRKQIEDAALFLMLCQNGDGLWSYGPAAGNFDHSNSQFALLGLNAAAQAGVAVPKQVWQRAREGVYATQNRDGGWCYNVAGGSSYGSMTAAGVADLLILGAAEHLSTESGFRDGVALGCGKYQTDKRLAAGLAWLGRNFRASQNPGAGEQMYVLYWLYAVERCGILSGRRFFGKHDWYREGAEFLVRTHVNGAWGSDTVNTCFGLLFLAKGRKPLLVQKLIWSPHEEWNPDRHDLEHLVDFIGDKLGEPVAWQTIAFDAPLEDWLAAPVLYMQGHHFPNWSPAQCEKVRQYVERGGVLLAEACCGRKDFVEGFRQFAQETFSGHALRALGAGHALLGAYYKLESSGLEGIDFGCRTSVFFSPRDLSCLWEQARVPEKSEAAFKLGTNIAAYVTGRGKLRDRLDAVKLPEAAEAPRITAAQLDAVRLAQITYDGDWQPDPHALANFVAYLRDDAGLDVVPPRQLRLTQAGLASCPILYLSGHYEFVLKPAERAALAAHLKRGGFLLIEACCGRAEFDASARLLLGKLATELNKPALNPVSLSAGAPAAAPNARVEPLPLNHSIFRGEPGFAIGKVAYRPRVLEETPGLDAPRLVGLTIDGRLAAVYSPFAIGCGLDGHECGDCRGLMPDDARRLTSNIVLYALSH